MKIRAVEQRKQAAKTSSEGLGGKTTYYFPFQTTLGFAGCFHSTSAGRFEMHRKPPATKTNCRSGKFKGFVMLFTRVACLLKPYLLGAEHEKKINAKKKLL